ncbi:MAG: heparinase II/III family protein [Victivallales bacterium]|nr:heparinase II/III family protein [Victivallales bacterium]
MTMEAASQFPIYKEYKVPKPAGVPEYNASDFSLDLDHVASRKGDFLIPDNEGLLKIAKLYSTPEYAETWKGCQLGMANRVNLWDLNRNGFASQRHIYSLQSIHTYAFWYLLSGNKHLGQLLHDHMLLGAQLPMEFWLHAELRGYNKELPKGQLECSTLAGSYAIALSLAGEIFTPEEKATIEAALREKGFVPSMNTVRNEPPPPKKLNNFAAVVSTGAFLVAKYFNDEKAMEESMALMKRYLLDTIEADGSYDEGTGYFSYPINTLSRGAAFMNREQIQRVYGEAPLRNSPVWMVYHYPFNPENEETRSWATHFGDNSWSFMPSVAVINSIIYQDPLAAWLVKYFRPKGNMSLDLLQLPFPEGIPAPKSPKELNLPLIRFFDDGDAFIRSSWDENSTLLSIHSHNPNKHMMSHRRPEINSICLFARGEYFVCSPASASYRAPIHYTYDTATRGANTISIDRQNQLFPGNGAGSWNTVDLSGFWQKGNPSSDNVTCEEFRLARVVVNEAKDAYHVKMSIARRAVIYVKKGDYFILVDRLAATDGPHEYTSYLHFNNRDEKTTLQKKDSNTWLCVRPTANLQIYLVSDQKLVFEKGKGYLHGKSRDYAPDGENQGKLGSAIELTTSNKQKSKEFTLLTVLAPNAVKQTRNIAGDLQTLTVDSDVITIQNGSLTLRQGKDAEAYQLW